MGYRSDVSVQRTVCTHIVLAHSESGVGRRSLLRVTRSVIGSKEVMIGGLEARDRRPAQEDKRAHQPGTMEQSGKIQKSNEQTHDPEVQPDGSGLIRHRPCLGRRRPGLPASSRVDGGGLRGGGLERQASTFYFDLSTSPGGKEGAQGAPFEILAFCQEK